MTISKSEGNKELQNNPLLVGYSGFFPNEKDILNAQRFFFSFSSQPHFLSFFFVISIVLEGMTHDISPILRKFIFVLQPYLNVGSWHLACSFSQCVKCAIQLSHMHDSTKFLLLHSQSLSAVSLGCSNKKWFNGDRSLASEHCEPSR